MAKKTAKTIVVLLALLSVIGTLRMPAVNAAGALYISPQSTNILPKGSSFSILVKVAGMDPFFGWRIQVVSNPSIINATSLSVTGNIIEANTTGGTPLETRHCVNGVGTGCCLQNLGHCNTVEGADGPGVVSSDYGNLNSVGGSGWLINITYQVIGAGSYSRIIIQPPGDYISGGTGEVAHTTHEGSYGSAPDIELTANPSSIAVSTGSSNTSTITLTSLHGFVGMVNLTYNKPGNGLVVAIKPNQTTLSVGGCNCTTVAVSVNASLTTPATIYSITVNATSKNATPRTLPISVSVNVPDFSLTASPSDVWTHQSSSNSTAVIVKSEYHFSGTVNLEVHTSIGPPGAIARFDQSNGGAMSLNLSPDRTVAATLTITTPASDTRFLYQFNLSASSGSLHHSFIVAAEPPPGDFAVSTNQGYATVQAGKTEVLTLNVTSLDYYVGTIYVLGTSPTGIVLQFSPGSFYIDADTTESSKLTILTNSTTATGNHTITLTILGEFGSSQQTHIVQLALDVTPAPPVTPAIILKTFLGLQEPEFFAIVFTLIASLAVLGVMESRRARRPARRSILEE